MKTTKTIKQSFFLYWDSLKLAKNEPLMYILNNAKKEKPLVLNGENNDFVAVSCAALAHKVGYSRQETVSRYFRAYKTQYLREFKQVQAAISNYTSPSTDN